MLSDHTAFHTHSHSPAYVCTEPSRHALLTSCISATVADITSGICAIFTDMYTAATLMYGALTVLLATASATVLVRAAIGYAQVRLMGSYNPPIIPKGSPGEPQQGRVIAGT